MLSAGMSGHGRNFCVDTMRKTLICKRTGFLVSFPVFKDGILHTWCTETSLVSHHFTDMRAVDSDCELAMFEIIIVSVELFCHVHMFNTRDGGLLTITSLARCSCCVCKAQGLLDFSQSDEYAQ